jgi:hypothetical protein
MVNSILQLNDISRIANIFFSVGTGKYCANLTPYGAVIKLVTEIKNTAGK